MNSLQFKLSPESLGSNEVLRLFDLRATENGLFDDELGLPITSYLQENITRVHSVTNNGKRQYYEAFFFG